MKLIIAIIQDEDSSRLICLQIPHHGKNDTDRNSRKI